MNRHGARRRFALAKLLAAGIFAVCPAVAGQTSKSAGADPRFWGTGVRPFAPAILSIEVRKDEEPIYSAASSASPRRGSAGLGARLPLFGAQLGPGCRGAWLMIAADAFVCEDGVEPSREAPWGLDGGPRSTPDGLPYRYYFVNKDGSFGYDELETAEDGVPSAQFQPGFGIAVQRIGDRSGSSFALSSRGFWLPLRDLSPVAATRFRGNAWVPNLAWVVREGAPLFSAPGRRKPGATLPRLTAVSVVEARASGSQRYVRVAESDWLRADDVRSPTATPAPAELRPLERWLDVDLSRQTLVAYVGERPVFATLISSGRGPAGSETATPLGAHRIWVKLRTSDMDNIEDTAARENYAIEAVPWVMFFQRGYGLHGTFWHQRFGEVRSHGCVNLAPLDAERLFAWTSPRLMPGWTAVLPTPLDPGTLVRVRSD
jgi:hypothetical protein